MTKVFIVEDNKIQWTVSERILSRAGYKVSGAVDGEEALQRIRLERPDVVVLDMMLPKVSGPEVLRALKCDPATASIPVVVVTGLSQKNEMRLMEDGAAAFIEKNWLLDNPHGLLDTLERVLATHVRRAPEALLFSEARAILPKAT